MNDLTLTLCLKDDCILVSRSVLDIMEAPRQIQMFINEERRLLLLKACTVEDREAVVIPASPDENFEMSGHAILRRIRRLTGWPDDLPRVIYGNYIHAHQAVVFDLMEAHISELRMPLEDPPSALS